MKIKLFSAALGIVLSATVISASAQKNYTEGTVTYSTDMRGQPVTITEYFRPDSQATTFEAGPAKIKLLADAGYKYLAVVVDVSAFNVKKAAIYTPDEIDQLMSGMPTFTFAPAADTKQISGFNCKKVVATDTKSKKTYDIWVTNDVTIPASAIPKYYNAIGGTPIQYTAFQQGQEASVTVTAITDAKAPKGTFGIDPSFDKISKDDLEAMSRGGQ
ncbi:hypothetical protein [Mucilaginibacter sp.]|jgi:hypothetical protein|uniref:hypothetical protein n=1 Tax=Mucilaginibacter sp. TaxID=1882438 RepID=UPI002C8C5C50|nr:hypothetical protein [Mucilaginibacter sp.]HTI61355.1 hypothetical protein [Mucilaginibacter sp.]